MRMSSKHIRQKFLNYFIKNGHKVVPSSSVIPNDDSSLLFTNAGMNQTKACSMAWELLTQDYGIPAKSLFVTYFGGDAKLGIPPDLECRDIWLSLGLPESHILPFDAKDNFWEMGLSGPCGPCTEIHFDRTGLKSSHLVNKDSQDVVEIWNLVFMEFNRKPNGELEKLKGHYVDTGMGLERLCAILNGKRSNYDTDLFMPIINEIQEVSKIQEYQGRFGLEDNNGLDTAYRIIADHARMIAIASADGAFPDENYRLRHVIRRALKIGSKAFKKDVTLLQHLMHPVIDTLGDVYPNLSSSLNRTQTILQYEEELFKKLEKESKKYLQALVGKPYADRLALEDLKGAAKLVEEIEKLRIKGVKSVPPTLVYQLNSDRGISVTAIKTICSGEEIGFNEDDFHVVSEKVKENSKTATVSGRLERDSKFKVFNYLNKRGLKHTDMSSQHSYSKYDSDYEFPKISAKVETILVDGESKSRIISGLFTIVLDKTNFYVESGGQIFDTGCIYCETGKARVISVSDLNGYILHHCEMVEGFLEEGISVVASIDESRRIKIMSNHTATHLLNYALEKCLNVTYQKSSFVGDEDLQFGFGVYSNFDLKTVETVEAIVNDLIDKRLDVKREVALKSEALEMADVRTLPGAEYPDQVSIIKIGENLSKELCCGTHVLNTEDLIKFVITDLRSLGSGAKLARAVTRDQGLEAEANAIYIDKNLKILKSKVSNNFETIEEMLSNLLVVQDDIAVLKNELLNTKLSLVKRRHFESEIDKCFRKVKGQPQTILNSVLKAQIEEKAVAARRNGLAFLVVSLEVPEAFRHFKRVEVRPDIVTKEMAKKDMAFAICYATSEGVFARTFIPKGISETLTAEKWIQSALRDLDARISGETAHVRNIPLQEVELRLKLIGEEDEFKAEKFKAQVELDIYLADQLQSEKKHSWYFSHISCPEEFKKYGAKPHLRKLAQKAPHIPILLTSFFDGSFVGYCRVPEGRCSENVSAYDWLRAAAASFEEPMEYEIRTGKDQKAESHIIASVAGDFAKAKSNFESGAINFAEKFFS
ncbi:alanine--tRNA ligase, cytoplasmic-like isoform X2 [Artemia franciscana]|uniref:alanine--tRNA ligase, cytoplasmic-like isoform X2 n=1 Tax=Artemia franciscana TaxID=6661 RepID=UPI0032DBB4A2